MSDDEAFRLLGVRLEDVPTKPFSFKDALEYLKKHKHKPRPRIVSPPCFQAYCDVMDGKMDVNDFMRRFGDEWMLA